MIVVKAGGSEGVNVETVCADVVGLVQQGEQVVLVHGGSHETNLISEKLGHPPRFVTSVSGHSSRYTDRETLEIFAMVVAGRINKLLVERLQRLGVNAIGLSGLDGRLLEGKRKASLQFVENGKRKVLRGEYPPGYTPKRESHAMIPLPYLKDKIPALAAYLASVQAGS